MPLLGSMAGEIGLDDEPRSRSRHGLERVRSVSLFQSGPVGRPQIFGSRLAAVWSCTVRYRHGLTHTVRGLPHLHQQSSSLLRLIFFLLSLELRLCTLSSSSPSSPSPPFAVISTSCPASRHTHRSCATRLSLLPGCDGLNVICLWCSQRLLTLEQAPSWSRHTHCKYDISLPPTRPSSPFSPNIRQTPSR